MSNEAQAAPAATATATATATAAVPATEPLTTQFSKALPEILKSTEHEEMWGVTLKDADDVPTSIVLTKFLRANTNDLAAAKKQLTSALEWRKRMKPLELVKESYDEEKFGGLGYITTHKSESGKETIISWNIYGAVKDNKKTFGDVEEFIKWRAALMELSVHKLNLPAATERIPEDGDDQYQMIQVHDYLSVSFFRPDPNVKKASSEAIRVFSLAYPELLAHKYFVNVPALMGWMYGLMKLFVAPATLKKFHPMSSGTTLGGELPEIVSTLPPAYGGKGEDVKTAGETVALTKETTIKTEEKTEAAVPAAADTPTPAVAKDETPIADATTTEETKPAETKPAETKTEDVKPTEPKAEEASKSEASKLAQQPNPLGSSPVIIAADPEPAAASQPVDESKTDASADDLKVDELKIDEAKAEPTTTDETKPEVKSEEAEEKK